MSTVTVSSKFQVVIPKDVREVAMLKPGTVLEVINYGERIELVPIRPLKNLTGRFRGINTELPRDEDRV